MIRVGVDVGGTFTDIVLERGLPGGGQQVVVHKVPSTPADQSEGVVRGVVEICGMVGCRPATWISCSTAPRWPRTWSSSATAPMSA